MSINKNEESCYQSFINVQNAAKHINSRTSQLDKKVRTEDRRLLNAGTQQNKKQQLCVWLSCIKQPPEMTILK